MSKTQESFSPGDIVLGKIKGYPPWPGILCSEDEIPKASVLSARPGKSYHIVRFFPAADYGFNKAHELRRLTHKEIEAFLGDPHRRAAELREAYKLARDPTEWHREQNERVKAAERAAEAAEEEQDQLAADEEDEPVAPPKKKQKRRSPSPQAVKKPKVEEKPQSSSAAAASSVDPAELDPETKKVKTWRHALQRGFLPKDGKITASEMDSHDETFKQVEAYPGITATHLRLTKIGKVMRRIIQLADIPRDEEFHFRQRAQTLTDKWAEIITNSGGGGSGNGNGNALAATGDTSAVGDLTKDEDGIANGRL